MFGKYLMSDEQQDAIIGRTLKEYQAAKKKLAALYAESEYFGNYLTAVGHSLRTSHRIRLSGDFSSVGLEKWPTAEQLKHLADEISATDAEKKRLADLLKIAGFEQPE